MDKLLNNTFDFSMDFSLIHGLFISFCEGNFKPKNMRKSELPTHNPEPAIGV